MTFFWKFPILLLIATAVAACASRREVAEDYHEVLGQNAAPASKRTVLLILVDGLPVETLSTEIKAGAVPNLTRYFNAGQKFFEARSTFPSLTFPAISSLLTGQPVDGTGVYGNLVRRDGRVYDMELFTDYPELNKLLQDKIVFARLKTKGLRSASFDYAFQTGSTVHTQTEDLKAGLSIGDQDYTYVDNKSIDSLRKLLKSTNPDLWPDFIFIHLVGVDLTSHDKGPDSPAVLAYLQGLDKRLGGVFEALSTVEQSGRRQVVALLTADHGFDVRVQHAVKLEEALHATDPGIKTLNEGHLLGVNFPAGWTDSRKEQLMSLIGRSPDVDVVAWQAQDKVVVQSHALSTQLFFTNSLGCGSSGFSLSVIPQTPGPTLAAASTWECADSLDAGLNALYYPYFISNLSHYFHAPSHPDAVIVSQPGVAFTTRYTGQHGGPAPRELFVPLLLHNADLSSPGQVPALKDILGFL